METYTPLIPESRDVEVMRRRCKPLKVGMVLILLMAVAVTLQLSSVAMESSTRLTVLGLMYVSSALVLMMLFSMCEKNSQNAAWLTVVLSPVVIGLFSLQLETIINGFFGLGIMQAQYVENSNVNVNAGNVSNVDMM